MARHTSLIGCLWVVALIFSTHADGKKPEVDTQKLRDAHWSAGLFMGSAAKNVAKTRIVTGDDGVQWIEAGNDSLHAAKTFSFLSYLYEDMSIFILTPEKHKARAVEHAQTVKDFLLKQENAPPVIRLYGNIYDGDGLAYIFSTAGVPYLIEKNNELVSLLNMKESATGLGKLLKQWRIHKELIADYRQNVLNAQ